MIIENSELQARQIHTEMSDEIELISIKIKTEKVYVIIGNIYMSPPTRPWEKDEYGKLIWDTEKCIKLKLQNAEDKLNIYCKSIS